VRFSNQKLLIIEHINLREMVYSVKEFLDLLKIMNVPVENIKGSDIKVLFVIDVVLK